MEAFRGAAAADLPEITALARAAVLELEPTRGGDLWALRHHRSEPIEAGLSVAIADASVRTIVGTIDEVVVGYAICHTEVLGDGSILAVVDDLYVDAEARGVAVGETMMNELVDWARGQGARGIDALVLPGNRPAKNFFESFGVVARAILVHRELDTATVA
jgi:ribosomal protein S18 acetylase RimI-like enzyme